MATSNYVVLETMALLQNRLGFDAAALWQRDILPTAEVVWIEPRTHGWAIDLWQGLGRKNLSLSFSDRSAER